jgi:2-dehydro-3-deoxygluconokinase
MVQLNALTSGPLRYVNSFEKHAAGTESNFAIGVVRMGLSAGWISRLGDDEFGKYIYNFIRGEGVDVSHVTFDSETPTGVYFIQRDYPIPGKSVVYYYRSGSAASRLTPSDIPLDYIGSAKILHTTGITLALSDSCRRAVSYITLALSDSCRRAVSYSMESAKNRGVEVSFDTNIRLKLWSPTEARKTIMKYLNLCDIVFTDLQDAKILVDEDDPVKAADNLLRLGPRIVVLKMGEKGSYAVTLRFR